MNWASLYKHKFLSVYVPVCVLTFVAFFTMSSWLMPLPPSKVIITSGPVDGMYYSHAQRYADLLRKHGLEVEVQESAGSGQNLLRLRCYRQ